MKEEYLNKTRDSVEDNNTLSDFELFLKTSLQEDLDVVFQDVEPPSISSLKKAEKKKKPFYRSFGKVAAIIVIVLLGANVILMINKSTDAYGDKGILHRIQQSVNGLFTDEEQPTQPNDIQKNLKITDPEDLDSAKAFFPQLYLPEYLPRGLELEEMDIDRYVSGDYLAGVKYKSKEGSYLYIGYIYTISEDDMKPVSNDKGELITLPDRKIYVVDDQINKEMSSMVYTEDVIMDVNSNLSREELIKVSKGLKQ